eukprot:1147821-Pelagomonas_calceolata.AAC.18
MGFDLQQGSLAAQPVMQDQRHSRLIVSPRHITSLVASFLCSSLLKNWLLVYVSCVFEHLNRASRRKH